MAWNVLVANASAFDRALLNLAFVFLLPGYGTKVELAPLYAWLPDAHAEGPTPISAMLSGLLLNVALFALLRFKMVMSANSGALAPGPLMLTLRLISVVFASFLLYRRHDIKRMFAYSSIEHMGIVTFAFGMGGPLANFAGLLHMTYHSLTTSAIFFSAGHIAQVKGTQLMSEIRGLTVSHPVLGWNPRGPATVASWKCMRCTTFSTTWSDSDFGLSRRSKQHRVVWATHCASTGEHNNSVVCTDPRVHREFLHLRPAIRASV